MYLNSGEDEKPGSVQQVAVVTNHLQQSVRALQVLHCDLETNEVKDPSFHKHVMLHVYTNTSKKYYACMSLYMCVQNRNIHGLRGQLTFLMKSDFLKWCLSLNRVISDIVHVQRLYVHVLMRDEKEERKKQARSNNKATQHTQGSHFSYEK